MTSLFQMVGELVLASASPRRRELLQMSGLTFKVVSADCDETPRPDETALEMVRRLAEAKARAVSASHQDAWVLGADTTVVCDGEIFGKPENELDARRMLTSLQGRWHEVWGGFAVVNAAQEKSIVEVHSSRVRIRPLTDSEIRGYWHTGEPCDKAGAYAIQGIGAALVEAVEGSYTNVVGLNLSRVIEVLIDLKVVKQV